MNSPEFGGTPRFEVRRRIGEGSMGVVYEAWDRERRTRVALKTLNRLDPAGISQLKQEFRSLGNVVHANLVRLRELVAHEHQWFFTMDFVEGKPLTEAESEIGVAGGDWRALREVFRQLAIGIDALHEAGKLHCDLKPSNVLVTPDRRVVILDFGLTRERTASVHVDREVEEGISGTPAYMAPEQATGGHPTSACDWYAMGVMLYEALTGVLPFDGPAHEVLFAKQHADPILPIDVRDDVPEDLNRLCADLLRREPARRPSGAEVRRCLGGARRESAPPSASDVSRGQMPFVGRMQPLSALRQAFQASRRADLVIVYVHGPSGIGKTELVRHFLEEVRTTNGALVLSGRCYERESVPFKVFDDLMDSLARYLNRLPRSEVVGWLPREIHLLRRLFPILGRVEAVHDVPQRTLDLPEQELRARAFGALKELVRRIADKQPVVIRIDDIHWGDVDSARLFFRLFGPPAPPPLLFVATYRSEDVGGSPFLREVLPRSGELRRTPREIALGPLSDNEARNLALRLLDGMDPDVTVRASAIARESGGHPYFIAELVREMGARAAQRETVRHTSLAELIRARVHRLGDEAMRLLEIIASAGHPLTQALAVEAAGLGARGHGALAALRSGNLVRTQGPRSEDAVETYHDRIRMAVLESLTPSQVRDYHRTLALNLEGAPESDPEMLAIHFDAAGEHERAAEHAATAAEAAAASLAFDRAAGLYRMALSRYPSDDERTRRLRTKLAQALENAGRGTEAGREYLAASTSGPDLERLELRRRAADQLLNSGRYDEGLRVLLPLLKELGIRYPATPRRAGLGLILRVAQLTLRGTKFRLREECDIDPRTLLRIDTLDSAARGLEFTDLVRALSFYSRYTLLALRAGEPLRIATGLASLSPGVSSLSDKAEAVARRADTPQAMAHVLKWRGVLSYLRGGWRAGLENLTAAERLFQDECIGAARDVRYCRTKSMICLLQLGELRELFRRADAHIPEAIDHGDRILEFMGRIFGTTHQRLAQDDPIEAREELARVQPCGDSCLSLFHACALSDIAAYTGDPSAAREHWRHCWPRIERSELFRLGFFLVQAAGARACALLAASPSDSGLREAERLADVIDSAPVVRSADRARLPMGRPLAESLRAGAAFARADMDSAARLLRSAARGYSNHDMKLHSAACNRQLGALLGADAGRDLIEDADQVMRSEGIALPERWAAMLVPGFD